MFILKLLVILCLVSQIFCEKKPLLVDQLRWDFLEMENELWNLSSNGLLFKEQSESELYLAKHFYDFDQKMKQMPENILRGLDPHRTISNFLFLYSELKVIEIKYEKFREYQHGQINQSPNKIMMEDIIYDILNNKTGITKSIGEVENLARSIEAELLEMILRSSCNTDQQSAHQLLYNFYNVVAFNTLKVYVMEQFAHLGNRLWATGTNLEQSISTRKLYEKRINAATKTMRNLFTTASKDIWRCDPKIHVKGQTYDEFTRLLQGHIQNEVDLSSQRTCKNTCNEYSYTKSHGCYDYESAFCRKVERCNGKIIGCRFIESHATICLAPRQSSRRYDYVEYDSGKTLGRNHVCADQKNVVSWTRWFVRCHYCMCLCDEHGARSDRYINLRPVKSDIQNNRVVTGLRLVKHNRILHLQIQEGRLLPYGYINESTVHWVPVDDYKITDSGVQNGADFFTMTYEHRSMALDEIQVNEDNYVVTGVRFEEIQNRVHFEIHVSPFDWLTGTVQQQNGYYIYETNPNTRSKISLSNADIPYFTTKPSVILGDTNSYVEFTHSDFNKDAAQTTIPFIDTQKVINHPPVPLMGAGIYYKGTSGYGGFIGPKIRTYDFGKHLSNILPKMGDRVDISEDVLVDVN